MNHPHRTLALITAMSCASSWLLDANRSAVSGNAPETRKTTLPESDVGVVTEHSQGLHGYIGFSHGVFLPIRLHSGHGFLCRGLAAC